MLVWDRMPAGGLRHPSHSLSVSAFCERPRPLCVRPSRTPPRLKLTSPSGERLCRLQASSGLQLLSRASLCLSRSGVRSLRRARVVCPVVHVFACFCLSVVLLLVSCVRMPVLSGISRNRTAISPSHLLPVPYVLQHLRRAASTAIARSLLIPPVLERAAAPVPCRARLCGRAYHLGPTM